MTLDPAVEDQANDLLRDGKCKFRVKLDHANCVAEGVPLPIDADLEMIEGFGLVILRDLKGEIIYERKFTGDYPKIQVIRKTNLDLDLEPSRDEKIRFSCESNLLRDVLIRLIRLTVMARAVADKQAERESKPERSIDSSDTSLRTEEKTEGIQSLSKELKSTDTSDGLREALHLRLENERLKTDHLETILTCRGLEEKLRKSDGENQRLLQENNSFRSEIVLLTQRHYEASNEAERWKDSCGRDEGERKFLIHELQLLRGELARLQDAYNTRTPESRECTSDTLLLKELTPRHETPPIMAAAESAGESGPIVDLQKLLEAKDEELAMLREESNHWRKKTESLVITLADQNLERDHTAERILGELKLENKLLKNKLKVIEGVTPKYEKDITFLTC